MADSKPRTIWPAGSGETRTILCGLSINQLLVSLVFSLAPTAGAQTKTIVAGTPIRLPLNEGKDIRFTHLSTEQGLSQSRVDHMLQDRRGFVWIGTYNGLNRYDGYRFKAYKPDPNSPNSLGDLRVTALFEDRSGILWIGIDQGLDRFDPASEKFTHFRTDPHNPDRPSGFPEHITQDRDGMLWLATHNGLDRLDPTSGHFTHYRNDPKDPNSLSSNDVRFVLEDRQGTLLVATAAGIDAFDRRTGRVLRYPNSQQPPLDRLLEDRSGNLWVSATRSGGVALLDRKTGVFTRYTWFGEWPGTPGMRGCSAINEDQHGMLWLATKPDGIVRFDRVRRVFTRYRYDPGDPISLNNSEALSLLEDREGGLWVGTNGGGVNRFPSKPSPFTIYRKDPADPNSLTEGDVLSVFEDSQAILWIGTSQLNRLDRKAGRYTYYRHDPANSESIASGAVHATAEDRAGFLWFGTWGGGLNRFDRKTGRFKAYRHDPADATSLSHDYILSLLIDHEGTLWAGTDDGLSRMDARTGRFTIFRPNSGSLERRWYRVLAEDPDGSIWMGTYTQGLQRLNVRTGEIVEYKNDPNVRGNLSNNRVNALHVDHSGTLWVGTQNGLNRFDRNTGTFTTFHERDGVPNNAVEGILEDSAGNLWLSTGNGLSRFDPRARTFKNYYSDDGLAGDEFNDASVYYKSAKGEMFFGGVNGVTAFHPEKVVDSSFVPPVVLTDFRLFNDPVSVGGNSPLRTSISYTDSLALSHGQNIFTIEFSALSFASPGRNRYRYRLEPLQKEWNETDSSRRMATYTTLPPGKYLFHVQGSNNHGSWNLEGSAVRIAVLAPWWGAWWFRGICAIAVVVIAWIWHRVRLRRRVVQLQRELKQLQDVINTIPAYVWSALPDGSVDFINRRWLEFSGLSLEQAAGWGWKEAVHPEDREHFLEAWRVSIASGNAMETEARVRRWDGQYRWLLIRNVPQRDATGKIVKWYGKSADIDDRKRAEETLRESETRFRTFVDHATDAFFMVEAEGTTVIDVNRRACESLGYTREELIGRSVFHFDVGVTPERLDQYVRPRIDAGESVTFETRHRRKDGTEFPVEIRVRDFHHGKARVLLSLALDITERKRTEGERERLRELETELAHINRVSMMGELAASIAHEVNQPLAGVVSNGGACLRWLASNVPNLEEAREAIRRIVRDGKRAGEVIARIRALTTRASTPREKVDLNQTIQEVLVLMGDKAKREGVSIETELADNLSALTGDRVQLQQVLLNLVMNAIEAMGTVGERPRELRISAANLDPDKVQVTVEDSGLGIDPNTMAKIFEPFYSTKAGGMGMGLSISRSIVESHGGRLWATPREVPGTAFHFTLRAYQTEGSLAGVAGL